MPAELNIRIAGQAGQGTQTIGEALSRLFKKSGKHVFAVPDYMSRVRGGNNFFQLRISDRPVHAIRSKCDIIAALDDLSVSLHKKDLAPGGKLILDRKKFGLQEIHSDLLDVPFYELAVNAGGGEIFVNTCVFAVIAGISGIGFDAVREAIGQIFTGKGDELIKKNIDAASAGYEFVQKNNFFAVKNFVPTGYEPAGTDNFLLMNGDQAVALGAVKAGCKFYSGYPMTPSTEIMNTVAHYSEKFNIVVEQAEDEIAAINMVIGASFCGARAMTATSGGGFALMTEGFSLAGMTETPIVIVDGQRPGPATGFPTRTEQADLDMLIHAGHGEFARVIYSPGDTNEAFGLTLKAFGVAEKYQIPVIVMTDQYLADAMSESEQFRAAGDRLERYIMAKNDPAGSAGYKRYALTDSGISPRAIPSWIDGVIYADSDEHTEEGHITESADLRVKMVKKRFYKKMSRLIEEIEPPVSFNLQDAHTVLTGFGSTYGVIKEAVQELGKGFGCVHFPQVWPFPSAQITTLLRGKKKILTVENNAAGQLARLMKREAGIAVNANILRYDGRPFMLDELCERVRELSK